MAAECIIRGPNGMKLGRCGPCQLQKVSCDAFGCLATTGPRLFIKRNPKMTDKGVIRGQNGMNLGRFGPWQ